LILALVPQGEAFIFEIEDLLSPESADDVIHHVVDDFVSDVVHNPKGSSELAIEKIHVEGS